MRMLGGHLAVISDLFPTRKTRKFRVRISQNNCGVWTSKGSIRKGSVVPLIQKAKVHFRLRQNTLILLFLRKDDACAVQYTEFCGSIC